MADYRVNKECSIIDYMMDIGYTRTKVRQLMRHRAVEVNGKAAKSIDSLLSKGDTLSVRQDRKQSKKLSMLGIALVYEDDGLIVIEKPSGLLTIASETEKTRTAYHQLIEFLRLRTPRLRERVFIVHRLDRDTSGLIVFAKNEQVKRTLQENWQEAEKRYYAVVEGTPLKKEGEIISGLRETKSLRVYSSGHPDRAKLSQTNYRVIRAGRDYSLLDITLATGRKNQIRVHLSDIGHPVAGDKKYGAKTDPLGRLALHSYRLTLRHPVTGEPMHFETKLPHRINKFILERMAG